MITEEHGTTTEATGIVVVERVRGKSTVTRCFAKYPLKFIIPNKVGSSATDAVWIYSISYGGGIVSGDRIDCRVTVGDGCTAVLTTQASTKVYKALGAKSSEQILDASVGSNALLVCIPDPVTCFASARYTQKQVFRVVEDSSLIVVDWLTSGRHESGERWGFKTYKSSNNVFVDGDRPLFVDAVLMGEDSRAGIREDMQGYNVVAMIIVLGPKLDGLRAEMQEQVKRMMSANYRSRGGGGYCRPEFVVSCSSFGPRSVGLVVRVAATTTESVYDFLRCQLAGIGPMIGAPPYRTNN